MAFKPVVTKVVPSDRNEAEGMYQFVVTLSDQSQHRLFMTKNPKWKLVGVNRLLNIPCPVCRKDYYCKCMDRHIPAIEEEVLDKLGE